MSYRHSRRSFLTQAALGTAALTVAPSLVMSTRAARAAKLSLENVHVDAARRAKELADGKPVTLTILEPSGSLGNIKPIAEQWKAATGIDIQYVEVPLDQINQKVLPVSYTHLDVYKRQADELALDNNDQVERRCLHRALCKKRRCRAL